MYNIHTDTHTYLHCIINTQTHTPTAVQNLNVSTVQKWDGAQFESVTMNRRSAEQGSRGRKRKESPKNKFKNSSYVKQYIIKNTSIELLLSEYKEVSFTSEDHRFNPKTATEKYKLKQYKPKQSKNPVE